MQPYYIHAMKKDTTKHPSEWHAHITNKASQILMTPLRYTIHMETAYYINNIQNTDNEERNALANKPKIQIKHRK